MTKLLERLTGGDKPGETAKHDAYDLDGHADARAVALRPAKTLANSCAMCTHFVSTGGGSGMCELVAGQVRADYVCDLFAVGDADLVGKNADFEVRKSDDPKQLIFGWASVAFEKDGTQVLDSQGDLLDADTLEDAAYMFVLHFREGDEMHGEEVAAHLVESFVVTEEKLEALGLEKGSLPIGWWTGFWIPDTATYEKARDHYPMFSIGGVGVREDAD